MNPSQNRCLIVGASTRGAAASAVRANYHPICADQFVDADLVEMATVLPLCNYPDDLVAEVKKIEPTHWMYTGALENSPGIIQKISEHHHLWGNGAEVVQQVRDPKKLYDVLRLHHLPALEVQAGSMPPVADGTWMQKPTRSAGGREIIVWNADAKQQQRKKKSHSCYYQQRATGKNYSVLYLAFAGHVSVVGISSQLIGCDWLNARETTWCGNVAPVRFSDQPETHQQLLQQARQTGTVVAEEFQLRGLFGIDYMLDHLHQSPKLFPLEVNPRYVSSVELYERAYDISLLNWHVSACQTFEDLPKNHLTYHNLEQEIELASQKCQVQGKAILYADHAFLFPFNLLKTKQHEMPACADIPHQGRLMQVDEPICTLFASGETSDDCLNNLKNQTFDLFELLKKE